MQRIMRITVLALACTVAMAVTARAAEAKHYRFVGEHPIPGGGFCHILAPHVHIYAPAKVDVLYRQHDGWNYFVGDPVAFGYEGPKYAYQGAHPINVDVAIGEVDVDGDEIEYCYIKGPHYHIVAPPAEAQFALRGDVYWYVGAYPPEFEAERPRYARINAVYEPMVYTRPVVLVGPPPGWHDVFVEVDTPGVIVAGPHGHAVVEGGVGVAAGVEVQVPVPTVQFGVSVGAAPVVVHDHSTVREVRVINHHDNGLHRGQFKHKGRGHW
jgi:hypothetical protein